MYYTVQYMMKLKNHRSITASCKRLFYKLGVAVVLSGALAGCPSAYTPIELPVFPTRQTEQNKKE